MPFSAEAQANDAVQRAVIAHLGEQPVGSLRMGNAVLKALRALPLEVKMEVFGIEHQESVEREREEAYRMIAILVKRHGGEIVISDKEIVEVAQHPNLESIRWPLNGPSEGVRLRVSS